MASIASLHIYPVKSCRGIDVASARMTETGLEWDRRWMMVDGNGKFVTQRTHPLLTIISTAIIDGRLELSATGHPTLIVDSESDGAAHPVRVWGDDCSGIDTGDEAAGWLSRVLGDRLRLVRMDDAVTRLADPRYAGTRPQPVSFADGYPVLLTSVESLAELNQRLPAPIPMNRFRPNVVIEGFEAYAEDAMVAFRSGAVALRGVKHCTRCINTTTDQFDGRRDAGSEPLKTLRTYRYDKVLRGVAFGQNCVVAEGVGEMLVAGAPLTIETHQV
jgi:MOSC domain-containing protein